MAKDDKTEDPTPKRLQESRKKGQVAKSVELPAGLGLALAVVMVPLVLPKVGTSLANDWRTAVALSIDAEPATGLAIFGQFFRNATMALLPAVAVVALGGTAAHWSMAGARPNPYQLKPKWDRINPKNGIKRLASSQALYELARNIAKLSLLGLVAYGGWKTGLERLLAGPGSLDRSLATVGIVIRDLLWRMGALGVIIGVADAIYSKRRHLKSLKMTKNEVKDESKQANGNPEVKAKRREKQLKLSRSRMIAEVAQADVVVTNPTHFAVALKYADGTAAPIVIAKGADDVAKRIREEARKWGVPVRENKPVARALFKACDIGDEIPVALYQAVAEVLAAVFRTRRVA